MKQINRRQFLRQAGSLALGVAFIGTAGTFVWKLFNSPGSLFHDEKEPDTPKQDGTPEFVSPYCRTAAFTAPDVIDALEVLDGNICLASQNNIYVYGLDGQLKNSFPVPSEVRDMAIYKGQLYLLFPSRVEVYEGQGFELVQEWKACNEDADYCCLTVMDEGVFVTDASNKHICQYNLDGSLARFITSPDGFIVPSYSFAITHIGDTIYCSNPGRHLVEAYTSKGEFIKSFGRAGSEDGAFSGCCNPSRLSCTNAGEILTSEKGVPRICCYGTDGTFRSVLLDEKMLGGGHVAYNVRVFQDKLIVTGEKKIQVFQYNPSMAAHTLCGSCTLDCPMKV